MEDGLVIIKVSKLGESLSMVAIQGKTSSSSQASSVREVQFNNRELKPFASIDDSSFTRQGNISKGRRQQKQKNTKQPIRIFLSVGQMLLFTIFQLMYLHHWSTFKVKDDS